MGRFALPVVVTLAVAARVAVVLNTDGVLYPDEVFQALEQAHRLALGHGLVPWEWSVGLRHPLFTWLLMPLMHLGTPQLTARLAVACCSGLATWPLVRLSEHLGATPSVASVVAGGWALGGWGVLLGARPLSETMCVLPLLLALAALASPSPRPVLAALVMSVAIMLRLHLALMALASVGWAAWAWPRGRVIRLLLGFAVGALVFGALDAAWWGDWFHSARAYLRFNLLEGGAQTFGVEPASAYARTAFHALGGLLLVVGCAAWSRGPAAALVALCAALFVGAHLLQPHKEFRFLLPAWPLLLALGAAGLTRLSLGRSPALAPGVMAVALLTQPGPWALSFHQLGIPLEPASGPAWDDGGAVNRLLVVAGRRDDACGVMLRGRELGYSGAYSWFDGSAPLYDARQPPRAEAAWNFLIVPATDPAAGLGVELAREGAFVLRKVRPGCVTEPFSGRLE
jgi:hypothetical protein